MAPAADAAGVEFPTAVELEKWMMSTAKEKDRGASFLRRVLTMNPAYGQQLAEDEDLSEIVQVFAKRFRQVIQGAGNPLQPEVLYKPLCEVIWRVVGQVLSSVTELTDGSDAPVPKQASGQVKMLLQTNLDLSNKLKEARRTYLIELTEHRDKQRHLSDNIQNVIQSLQEQPVMFYEPLEYVLDETTKDFVRLVVEERVKLEMRAGYTNDEANAEIAYHMKDLEVQMAKKEAELKKLRIEAAKNEQEKRKALDAQAKAENEKQQANALAKQKQEEFDEIAGKFATLEWELSQKQRRIAFLEQQQQPGDRQQSPEAVRALNEQLESQEGEKRMLLEKLAKLQAEKDKSDAAAAAAIGAAAAAAAAAKGANQTEVVEVASPTQVIAGADVVQVEKETVVQEKIVEKIVYVSTDEGAQQEREELMQKHLEVEQELRDALSALQKQLDEEQEHSRKLASAPPEEKIKIIKEKEVKTEEEAKKLKKKKTIVAPDDAEIEKAIKKVTAQFEKQVKELQAEIDRLQAELAAANGEFETAQQKHQKALRAMQEAAEKEDEKQGKWKRKYEELEDKHDDLQDEYAKLEQKVNALLDKMKEKMTDDEVQETLTRIRLSPPPPRKKRKKKAYERLYDDAQRRLVDMRMKQEKATKAQEQALADAAHKVKDRRSLRAVEALVHLQKAASVTSTRFQDAVSKFQEQHPDDPTAEAMPGVDGIGFSTAGFTLNSTIPEEESAEWVAASAQYAQDQGQMQSTLRPEQLGNRGRTTSRSVSTPPGRTASTSPGLDVEMSMSQAGEMQFTQQFRGSVSQLMANSMSGSLSAELSMSPASSASSVSPAMRRRYGPSHGTQSHAMPNGPIGIGGVQLARSGMQSNTCQNPAMPRASSQTAQSSSWRQLGRQGIAQAAATQPARKPGEDMWLPPHIAAGTPHLDLAGQQSMGGRRQAYTTDHVPGDFGGMRASDELLMQATPPGVSPTVSPSPPGFSTRLGNESGRTPKMHTPLDPMAKTMGSLSPPARRHESSRHEENFSETLQGSSYVQRPTAQPSPHWHSTISGGGQKFANSWGGALSRSTPDLTVMASSFHQGDLGNQAWNPFRKGSGKAKQKKPGNVAMMGLTVLGQSP